MDLVVMPQELLNLELNFNSRRLQSCGNGCGPTRVVEPQVELALVEDFNLMDLVVMPQELLNPELNFNSRRLQSCGDGCGPTRVVEP